MKLKQYLKSNDNDTFRDQIREVNEIVLGVNTWLYIQDPLFEDVYYPIETALTEGEKEHFTLVNEVSREEKQRRKELAAEYQATKDIQSSEWDKEVEKVFKSLTSKAKISFHALDDLGKKSFIGKYILHGLEASPTTGWGRQATADRDQKELYSDHLKSYKDEYYPCRSCYN